VSRRGLGRRRERKRDEEAAAARVGRLEPDAPVRPLDDQAAAGVLMWVPMSLAGGCVRMARPHLNMSPRSHRLHQSERAIPPARLAANALIVETTL
jgi:hypothetical protein